MSRRLLILIPALMALTWMSCTTKRDGRAYRLYHNTTAKYNGFFYANEAHAEAEVKLEELHDERWDEILPLFLESDEESAQQIFPLMERAIEKCTRVVDRHTMAPPKRMTKSFSRPVMNKWIDPVGQNPGLPGARSCNHHHGPIHVGCRLPLDVVEIF